MNFVDVSCANCGAAFRRPYRRANEAQKRGWNQYCSKQCQNTFKTTAATKKCGNPSCSNVARRGQSEFRKSQSGRIYCSQSCAATISNTERAVPPRYCKAEGCSNQITYGKLYCSRICSGFDHGYTSETAARKVVKRIQSFYKKYGRIPVKREMQGSYHSTMLAFNSWNEAIKAAGFTPNSVKFTTRRRARDGHLCDSFAEKIIDDWLHEYSIPHERHAPYGKNKMTADFKVGEIYIEFIGLEGEHRAYDEALARKRRFFRIHNLPVIELRPSDLFPEHSLEEILLPHLKKHITHTL